MEHEDVFRLSERHAPPHTDLRFACILDYWGDDRLATHPVDHKHPSDVTRGDLDAYPQKWAFMELPHLLFYLYPLAKEFAAAPDELTNCLWSFLYCLNSLLEDRFSELDSFDQEGVRDGLQWLHESDPLRETDPNITFGTLRRILRLPRLENDD